MTGEDIVRTFTLLLLALCLSGPAAAREKLSDADARKVAEAASDKFNEGWNKADMALLGSLFTKDATLVTPMGRMTGIPAISGDLGHAAGKSVHTTTVDEAHAVGSAAAWATGSYKAQGPEGKPSFGGFWTALYQRQGKEWKMRLLMVAASPPPAK